MDSIGSAVSESGVIQTNITELSVVLSNNQIHISVIPVLIFRYCCDLDVRSGSPKCCKQVVLKTVYCRLLIMSSDKMPVLMFSVAESKLDSLTTGQTIT